jgi:membrane carboxypeptidase/penicillin-binding protein PbpC
MERLGLSGQGTPHGMRAAFSTYFNATGANIDVIEHCLAHVPANRVRAAYNRHQYKEERRAMLQAWADFLDSSTSTEAPAPKATSARPNRRLVSVGVKMASLGGAR